MRSRIAIRSPFASAADGSASRGPAQLIPAKHRHIVQKHEIPWGIGVLEDLVGEGKAQGVLAIRIPDLASKLSQEHEGKEILVLRARATLPAGAVRNVVRTARQTAVEFLLECEGQGITLSGVIEDRTEGGQNGEQGWRRGLRRE